MSTKKLVWLKERKEIPLKVINRSKISDGDRRLYESKNIMLSKTNLDEVFLEGEVAEFGTLENHSENENDRWYTKEPYLEEVDRLQPIILGCRLFGALDHDDDYAVKMKEVSHMVTALYFCEKRQRVIIQIKLIPTIIGGGIDAIAIVNAGGNLSISARAIGYYDEDTHEAVMDTIFTYDIVDTPGMAFATLNIVETRDNLLIADVSEADRSIINRLLSQKKIITLNENKMTEPIKNEDLFEIPVVKDGVEASVVFDYNEEAEETPIVLVKVIKGDNVIDPSVMTGQEFLDYAELVEAGLLTSDLFENKKVGRRLTGISQRLYEAKKRYQKRLVKLNEGRAEKIIREIAKRLNPDMDVNSTEFTEKMDDVEFTSLDVIKGDIKDGRSDEDIIAESVKHLGDMSESSTPELSTHKLQGIGGDADKYYRKTKDGIWLEHSQEKGWVGSHDDIKEEGLVKLNEAKSDDYYQNYDVKELWNEVSDTNKNLTLEDKINSIVGLTSGKGFFDVLDDLVDFGIVDKTDPETSKLLGEDKTKLNESYDDRGEELDAHQEELESFVGAFEENFASNLSQQNPIKYDVLREWFDESDNETGVSWEQFMSSISQHSNLFESNNLNESTKFETTSELEGHYSEAKDQADAEYKWDDKLSNAENHDNSKALADKKFKAKHGVDYETTFTKLNEAKKQKLNEGVTLEEEKWYCERYDQLIKEKYGDKWESDEALNDDSLNHQVEAEFKAKFGKEMLYESKKVKLNEVTTDGEAMAMLNDIDKSIAKRLFDDIIKLYGSIAEAQRQYEEDADAMVIKTLDVVGGYAGEPSFEPLFESKKRKLNEAKEVEFPNSNLYYKGFGVDTNGNKIIKIGFPNERGFSIQTNGNLRDTQSILEKNENPSEGDLAVIEREVIDYVDQFGTETQKKRLKKYGALNESKRRKLNENAGEEALSPIIEFFDAGHTAFDLYNPEYFDKAVAYFEKETGNKFPEDKIQELKNYIEDCNLAKEEAKTEKLNESSEPAYKEYTIADKEELIKLFNQGLLVEGSVDGKFKEVESVEDIDNFDNFVVRFDNVDESKKNLNEGKKEIEDEIEVLVDAISLAKANGNDGDVEKFTSEMNGLKLQLSTLNESKKRKLNENIEVGDTKITFIDQNGNEIKDATVSSESDGKYNITKDNRMITLTKEQVELAIGGKLNLNESEKRKLNENTDTVMNEELEKLLTKYDGMQDTQKDAIRKVYDTLVKDGETPESALEYVKNTASLNGSPLNESVVEILPSQQELIDSIEFSLDDIAKKVSDKLGSAVSSINESRKLKKGNRAKVFGEKVVILNESKDVYKVQYDDGNEEEVPSGEVKPLVDNTVSAPDVKTIFDDMKDDAIEAIRKEEFSSEPIVIQMADLKESVKKVIRKNCRKLCESYDDAKKLSDEIIDEVGLSNGEFSLTGEVSVPTTKEIVGEINELKTMVSTLVAQNEKLTAENARLIASSESVISEATTKMSTISESYKKMFEDVETIKPYVVDQAIKNNSVDTTIESFITDKVEALKATKPYLGCLSDAQLTVWLNYPNKISKEVIEEQLASCAEDFNAQDILALAGMVDVDLATELSVA